MIVFAADLKVLPLAVFGVVLCITLGVKGCSLQTAASSLLRRTFLRAYTHQPDHRRDESRLERSP